MIKTQFSSKMSGPLASVYRAVAFSSTYAEIAAVDAGVPIVLGFNADVIVGGLTVKAGTVFTMCTDTSVADLFCFTGIIHSHSTDVWYALDASVDSNNAWALTLKSL